MVTSPPRPRPDAPLAPMIGARALLMLATTVPQALPAHRGKFGAGAKSAPWSVA